MSRIDIEGNDGNQLDNLSVSRPKERASWGIPVPNDEDHRIYVWLDALTNYLTVFGLGQGADFKDKLLQENVKKIVHIMGRDIVKFHCIYWPAFLRSAFGKPIFPKHVLTHCHWLKDNRKMSKSIGNIVDPKHLI